MTSTIGRFSHHELIEGTPESRRKALMERTREAHVLAARAHRGWREFSPADLTLYKHGFATFFATPDDELLMPVRTQVFQDHLRENDLQVGCSVWNEGAACAFSVDENGNVTVYEPAPIRSVTLLKVAKLKRQLRLDANKSEARERDREVEAFQRSQPLKKVTLADLERRELPTLQAAAQRILEIGGQLTVRHGSLEVSVPERLAPDTAEHDRLHAEVVDAALVLLAAGPIVTGAVESDSKKSLLERLPDVQVLAAGGIE